MPKSTIFISPPSCKQVRNHHAYHGIYPSDIGITFNKSTAYLKKYDKVVDRGEIPMGIIKQG